MAPKKSPKEVETKRLLKEANKLLTGKPADPEEALEVCEEVLKMDKENYYAWLFKGLALSKMGEHEGQELGVLNDHQRNAVNALSMAIKLNPEAIFPWKALVDIRAMDAAFVDFFGTMEQCVMLMVELHGRKAPEVTEEGEEKPFSPTDLPSDDVNYIRFHINDYIKRFDYKNNDKLHIHYLHFITPHLSRLGTILGNKIQSPVLSVNMLIDIYSHTEESQIRAALQKAKQTWPINVSAQEKFQREGDVKWSVYKNSAILKENLWELLTDLEALEDEKVANDHKRWKVTARQIEYLDKVLYCAPDGTRAVAQPRKTTLVIGKNSKPAPTPQLPSDEKSRLRSRIHELQSTLVLLKAQIQSVWDQHFEWCDPLSLAKIDVNEVVCYMKLFGKNKGLGKLFYMLSISEISPWENVQSLLESRKSKKAKAKDRKSSKNKKDKKDKPEDEEADDSEEASKPELAIGPQQIFAEMTEVMNSKDIATSVLAHRIYLTFAIHLKEYQLALDQSHKYAALLADLKLKTGLQLKNSSLDYAFNLAIIYTYFESPKNFPKAEKLYVKVLTDDPSNVRASIGMARIKMETGKFAESKAMFEKVLQTVDSTHKIDIGEVLMEYGWCCINQGEYENGRKALNKAKAVVFGDEKNDEDASSEEVEEAEDENDTAAASLDVKATLLYREAQSYFMELNSADFSNEIRISYTQNAFQLLIQSIRISPTYAPAYTSLGELYTSNAESCEEEAEIAANKTKAFKCFYRAFELDPGELRSTYAVTEHFSDKKDWEMVDLICNSVLENERARKAIVNVAKTVARTKYVSPWPYRILGIVHMEKQDDNKAIEYFQSALRIDQHDYASWIALGEAYLSRGKIEAGKRVFKHVICLQALQGYKEIDSFVDEDLSKEILEKAQWHPIFLLAEACSLLGEFVEAFELLEFLISRNDLDDMRSFVLTKICEVLVARAGKEIYSGAVMRSLVTIKEAFVFFEQALNVGASLKLWKVYGECLLLCVNTQSHLGKLPFDILNAITKISTGQIEACENFVASEVWESVACKTKMVVSESQSRREQLDCVHYALVLAGFTACARAPSNSNRLLVASLLYNVAIQFTSWYRDSRLDAHRDAAITLLKKAIQFEPTNAGYWNTLGLTCMSRNARVAQHCFIKALSIDAKAAPVWFNLAMLYVKWRDYELANQALLRSQSLAPGTSSAWAGQAVVASATGNKEQAKAMFTHSFVTSNGKNVGTTLLYSSNVLERIIEGFAEERDLDDVQQLTSASSAILKYLNHYPEDAFGLEIACSIVERLRMYDKGLVLSEQLCALAKAQFETEEFNAANATTYAKVLVQKSRLQLGQGDFSDAKASAGEATYVLDTLFARDLFDETIQRIQLSTFCVGGLALYFEQDYDGALQELNRIVEAFPNTKRVVVLISQVLYALGSEETKEAAMEELLLHIQEQGSSLLVVLTFAAISIKENWTDYMDAVKDELERLDFTARIEDLHKEVPLLLSMINERLNNNLANVWQRSALMFPGDGAVWAHLNATTALEVSKSSGNIDANALAQASIATGTLRGVQRGIFLSPGAFESHRDLLEAIS